MHFWNLVPNVLLSMFFSRLFYKKTVGADSVGREKKEGGGTERTFALNILIWYLQNELTYT